MLDRQSDRKFRPRSHLWPTVNRPAVFFDDNFVADCQSQTSTYTSRFSRKECLKHFFLTAAGIPVPLSEIRTTTE